MTQKTAKKRMFNFACGIICMVVSVLFYYGVAMAYLSFAPIFHPPGPNSESRFELSIHSISKKIGKNPILKLFFENGSPNIFLSPESNNLLILNHEWREKVMEVQLWDINNNRMTEYHSFSNISDWRDIRWSKKVLLVSERTGQVKHAKEKSRAAWTEDIYTDKLYDLKTGKEIGIPSYGKKQGEKQAAIEAALWKYSVTVFSPDGKQKIAGKNCSAQYLDVKTGVVEREIKIPPPASYSACDFYNISPDGRYVFMRTCDFDFNDRHSSDCMTTYHFWKVGGKEGAKSFLNYRIWDALFSPDSRYVAISFQEGVGVWELN